jgi:hypothetical protein
LRPPAPLEHDEQVALIEWWDLACKRFRLPPFALFAIPNAGAGAQRGQAGKLKAEGMRKGVCDLFLGVPRIYGSVVKAGLFIEMKRRPRKPDADQEAFIAFMRAMQYVCVVAYSMEEAKQAITEYLMDRLPQ